MGLDDAILRGGQNRVRPIIMTAAATITAMTPPALGLAGQSSFVSGPMAIAVIGGLIASTLIILIIIPVLITHRGLDLSRPASRRRPPDGLTH